MALWQMRRIQQSWPKRWRLKGAMAFFGRRQIIIPTPQLVLRLPEMRDYAEWSQLRAKSREFLRDWEPVWASDHLTRRAFRARVLWSQRAAKDGKAVPLLLTQKETGRILGALTLDHIRRGPSQSGTLGYWIGSEFARQGYMSEALEAIVDYAFDKLDLGRLEAACLPENKPSRDLLEGVGFKYEGVAQAYLQINGRWRTHVLYANLRRDRRGRTDAG